MLDPIITRVRAREVLDSRGRPTVEADVTTAGGGFGRAIAPSGASTGRHEAVELRDGDMARYRGRGVLRAVRNVHEFIAPMLVGRDTHSQTCIDASMIELDGTPNKAKLGANAILAVSMACAHAAASCQRVPLWRYLAPGKPTMPVPMVNMISGGLHAGGNLDVQDFLFVPLNAASVAEALVWTAEVYACLGELLRSAGQEGTLVGDEGGFGPRLRSSEVALEFVLRAIKKAGLTPGVHGAIAIDVASTQLYARGRYHLKGEGQSYDAGGMVEKMRRWCDAYPIISIEDGLAEDDWEGWAYLTATLGERVQLVGDDLFATNAERLRHGVAAKAGNAVLIKLNQAGTLTETLEVIRAARSAGYGTVVSARSGETEDSTMSDLAVATGAGQIKIGCIVRGERLAKYNQLLRIEEELA